MLKEQRLQRCEGVDEFDCAERENKRSRLVSAAKASYGWRNCG